MDDTLTITPSKVCRRTVESSLNPLVSIVEEPIVFTELSEGFVRAVFAPIHLLFGGFAELLKRSLVNVLGFDICIGRGVDSVTLATDLE